MLNISLLALILWGGILAGPFRIADAEQGHHQGCLRAAMASDGHFAVAWLDSLQLDRWRCELDLYIRFFNQDGSPLTDAYKITKAVDTNEIGGSHLDMDSQGNTVLLWTEVSGEDLLRLQLFDTSGSAIGSPQTDHQGYVSWKNRSVAVSLNDQGEFAIVWDVGVGIFARRYSFQGGPQGDSFRVHGDLPDGVYFYHPGVALNDAGDLVVTWYESHRDGDNYPKFQVFDAEDEPILDWEPMGHLVVDDSLGGSRVEPYWLDNDRFALFWIDYFPPPWHIAGRVFSDRGLTRCPICRLVRDSLALTWPDPTGRFTVAMSSDERFAETHTRSYTDYPDTSDPSKKRHWEHGVGILGYIQDNEPIRRTTLFEYTPPWGADTVNSYFNNLPHTQPPAVACCNDCIVWVYSRFNTDTIFEAYAMVTDWNMGVGVEESAPKIVSPIYLSASLNRLSYDVPGEASLILYSVDGRRVLQETIQGKDVWEAPFLPSGVYFARVVCPSAKATAKLVILH
jgi:hypothetical protein